MKQPNDEQIAFLLSFAREVVEEHFEYNDVFIEAHGQCDWCLWLPGRDWEPEHECSLRDAALLLEELED